MTDAKSRAAESEPVSCDSFCSSSPAESLVCVRAAALLFPPRYTRVTAEGTDDTLPSAKHVNTYSAENRATLWLIPPHRWNARSLIYYDGICMKIFMLTT